MLERSRKRPRDPSQFAKFIIDVATGEATDRDESQSGKNPAAVALGRLGGKKGGMARSQRLSPERRTEIARAAAVARWKGHDR